MNGGSMKYYVFYRLVEQKGDIFQRGSDGYPDRETALIAVRGEQALDRAFSERYSNRIEYFIAELVP